MLSDDHLADLRSRFAECLYGTWESKGSAWEDQVVDATTIYDRVAEEYKDMRETLKQYDGMIHELLSVCQIGDGDQSRAKASEIKSRLIKILS